ncbi:MAG: sigma-70 family RNA polymerase sigma factor [Firmicutes bacterium]|nr:sigma-70 family RNA polymerase sigma factor [Bacillota bacterium]
MNAFKLFFNKVKSFFSEDINQDREALEKLVLYIAEGVGLPSPLEAVEEARMIERFEAGDMDARAVLIERNLRLVVFVAKKFLTSGHSLDDLISIGSIGLIKAVNSFKQDKNIKLATYASRCIENEILMFLRKTVKHKREVSLEAPIKKDDSGSDMSLTDILEEMEGDDIFGTINKEEDRKIILDAVKKLSQREQEIMILRFGLDGREEKTQKEVADFLDISQSYISRLEKKIIDRLKVELAQLRNN